MSLDEARAVASGIESASVELPPRGIGSVVKRIERRLTRRAASVERQPQIVDTLPVDAAASEATLRHYMTLADRARGLHRLSDAIAYAAKAAEAAQRIQDPRAAGLFAQLMKLEADVADIASAIDHGNRSLALVTASGHNVATGAVSTSAELAMIYASVGDLANARRHLATVAARVEANERRRAPSLERHNAVLNMVRAEILEAEGRHVEAEGLLRRSVATAEEILDDDRAGGGSGHRSQEDLELRAGLLSRNLLFQGRVVEAEVEARRALDLTLDRDSGGRALPKRLIALADVFSHQGRHRDALRLAELAVKVHEASGAVANSWGLLGARLAEAEALVALGRFRRALEVYEKIEAALQGDAFGARRFLEGNPGHALTLLKSGATDRAIAVARAGLARAGAQFGENHPDTAEARGLVGLGLIAGGRQAEGFGELERAVPVLTTNFVSDAREDGGDGASSRRHRHIVEMAMLAWAEKRPGPQTTDALFRLADAWRAQAVGRAMYDASARALAKDSDLAILVRQVQDLRKQIAALQRSLANATGGGGDALAEQRRNLQSRIGAAQAAEIRLAAEIGRRFPDFKSLTDPRPLGIAEIQAAMRPGEALVATYVVDGRTFVWGIPNTGPAKFVLTGLGRGRTAEWVDTLRRAVEPKGATIGDIPDFDVQTASRLYDALLRPVEASFADAQTLLIVPSGPLAALPLGLLVTGPYVLPADGPLLFDRYRGVPWLARRHAVAQLPSAGTLALLRRLPDGAADRKAFVGFGDPIFRRTEARLADPSSQVALRGVRVIEKGALDDDETETSGIAALVRLPDTADELREIAEALGADPIADVRLREAANEDAVRRSDIAKRRVVVFATHGLVPGDIDGLREPALALTPASAGGAGDGLLRLGEILTLKLDADWVVLSACNTAAAGGRGSEAVSGLGRAFFFAGARALLVSNWAVESQSARSITTGLFKRQAGAGNLSRARALQASTLDLLDNGAFVDRATGRAAYAYAHPIFWAPFSLVGDAGG